MPTSHPAWPWPTLIAHRGGGHLAPENTLAAFRTGAAHGYSMVEYDVKLSQDGVLFLLHDDTVDRCSDGRGNAAEMDWKTLSGLDFGSRHSTAFAGEMAPTLRAVARYTQAQGIHSNIEIKPSTGHEAATGAAVAHAVKQWWTHAFPQPLLSSFSDTALDAARQIAPDVPRALLIEGPVPADWHARVQALGCIGVNIDTEHADKAVVRDIVGRGVTLAVWTVNDAARARELLSWGCQAIVTDALDTVQSALMHTDP